MEFKLKTIVLFVSVMILVDGRVYEENEKLVYSPDWDYFDSFGKTIYFPSYKYNPMLLKRNNNMFKNFKINKDVSEPVVYDEPKEEHISYIPRVGSSSGNGGKRGAILTWAFPNNRMKVVAQASYRQAEDTEGDGSRPAARK